MMLSYRIARRYFFSGQLSNVINIISGVSLLGVVVGSFALVVVLSVFNGFEKVVVSLFNTFDSDLKISLREGKYFHPDSAGFRRLSELRGIAGITPVIEENVLIKANDQQTIARFRALEPSYLATTGLDTMIISGQGRLTEGSYPRALLGGGIAGKLGIYAQSRFEAIQMFLPRKTTRVILNPQKAFVQRSVRPAGVFAIQQEFDNRYLLLPLAFGRKLAQEPRRVTALEINLQAAAPLSDLRRKVVQIVGPAYKVADRYQQHATLYKVFKSEKLAVYLILSFILLIAAFNLVGSLTMIAIEKKHDMAILKSMGADKHLVRNIFLVEGLQLALIGAFLGIGLGALVCGLQMNYGLIPIQGGQTFVLQYYPVAFQASDFVFIFLTVAGLGVLASLYPAQVASRQLVVSDLRD